MSNRAYLTACEHERIYPWFGDLAFDRDREVLLACDGCVPLLWMCLFAESDLRAHAFTVRGHTLDKVAPLAERVTAIARLRARKPLLSAWFTRNGGLDAFVDLLATHLEAQPGKFVSIELDEIEALNAEYDMVDVVRTALERLDAEQETCLDLLVPLSTLLEDRPFLPPGEVARSGAREDTWNVFRLIGGGWVLETPWDDLDPDAELRRTLNRSRRRDALELLVPG
jgi:hypothetical protein